MAYTTETTQSQARFIGRWVDESFVVSAQEAAARTSMAGSDIELLAVISKTHPKSLVMTSEDVYVDLAPFVGVRATIELSGRQLS